MSKVGIKQKTYTQRYSCRNCGHDFMQEFPFGEPAHQGRCPNCGVSPAETKRQWEEQY